MSGSVQRKMAAGAMWMMCLKLSDRVLGFVSTLILARMLAPSDFGAVAMAMSFIVLAQMMTSFDFEIAIIQDQSAGIDHYHTAWTCNLLFGLLAASAILAAALPIAHFYRNPDLAPLVAVLALGPLLTSAENIGVVAFRKDLDFRRDFIFQASRRILSFVISVALAFLVRSYWALAVGLLMSKLAGTALSYWMHPFRPRLTLVKYRELMVFSRWLLLNNLVAVVRDHAADFFVGRSLGAGALGSYTMARELSYVPITEISAPVNRSALPGFAKLTCKVDVAATYLGVVGFMALLALPAAAGICAVSPLLVPVVLGPKWAEVVPVLEIMALNAGLMLFHPSVYAVLIGRGYAGRINVVDACYAVVLLALLALAFLVRPGVTSAACATLLTSALCAPLYLYQLRKAVGVPLIGFAKAVVRPACAAGLMAVAVRAMLPPLDATLTMASGAAWLLFAVAGGALVYAALVGAIWVATGRPEGPERVVLDRVRTAWDGMATRRSWPWGGDYDLAPAWAAKNSPSDVRGARLAEPLPLGAPEREQEKVGA